MNIRPWFRNCCALLPAAVLLIALSGCSGSKSEPPKAATPSPQTALAPLETPAAPGLNVGDVEAGVVVAATIPPESISEQVRVENMETKRDRLAMATVTVKPPYPEKLNIQVTLTPKVSFEKQPVVVRGKMRRDEQPIEPQYAVLVTEGTPTGRVTIKADFDVMTGLPTPPPDTMLVYARFDAYLMPLDTPAAGLDPATAQSDQHTELLSNPVRINFVK